MKQLMMDYWRRKSVVLIFGAVVEFIIGLFSTIHYDKHPYLLAPFQMQIGIFLGPFLLSFDLQRGLARTVSALPLTARQIARAWWFATVGIPSAVFMAFLLFGAAAISLLKQNVVIDWPWLAIASVILFLWMGSTFTMIFVTGYGFGSGWKRVGNILGGVLWGVMVGGGMWLFGMVSRNSIRTAGVITLGVVLTAVGWFMAEQLVAGRAAYRPGNQTSGRRPGCVPLQLGYGGIPRLMISTLTRALLSGLAMIVIMALFLFLQGGPKYDWAGAIKAMLGMGFFPFWFVTFVTLLPAFLQTRLLRSLPISATKLAAVMIGIVLLPLVILGCLIAGVIGATLGMQTVVSFASTFLLTIPIATLCVVLMFSLGNGMLSLLTMMLLLVLTQSAWVSFQSYTKVGLGTAAEIIGVCVVICFFAVRQCLLRGSKPYRIQATAFGAPNWWQTR